MSVDSKAALSFLLFRRGQSVGSFIAGFVCVCVCVCVRIRTPVVEFGYGFGFLINNLQCLLCDCHRTLPLGHNYVGEVRRICSKEILIPNSKPASLFHIEVVLRRQLSLLPHCPFRYASVLINSAENDF